MNSDIEKAIEILAKRITDASTPDEALKFTQAALNLAHVHATLEGAKHLQKMSPQGT